MMLPVRQVLPSNLASALDDGRYWFVIGGQAVRCFVPYRPSRDADFGVVSAKDLKTFVNHLQTRGKVELIENSRDTVHLNFEGVDVSVFVLPTLATFTEKQVLNPTAILATKTHAILDRGTRRDFFDLYVMLQTQSSGVAMCLEALVTVYATHINQGLVLRSLCYFEDAEREGPLPGEGDQDWATVKAYFARAVAALIVPPTTELAIQSNVVDVRPAKGTARSQPHKKKRTARSTRVSKAAMQESVPSKRGKK
jgi:Nucleotidyl transferase AbiEii toxin, Type IV TA system